MQIRKAGWVALLAAAGVGLCIAAPVEAATARARPDAASADKPIVLSKFSKRKSRAVKKARAAPARHARKSSARQASRRTTKTSDEAARPAAKAAALPAAVAEAHAEAPASGTFAEDEARNIAALDDTDIVSSIDGVQIAAAGQLNDMDHAAEAAPPPASAVEAPASAPKMFATVPAADGQAARPDESDPWSKTSLIGKILIALGSLLTLASAARLLIA